MNSGISIPAIIIANIMGITILFIVAVNNSRSIKESVKRYRYIMTVFFATLTSCIVDPICSLADGKPGIINYLLVLLCNTILYFSSVVIATTWILLIADRMHVRISKFHKSILAIFFVIVTVLLTVNLFVPILFTVNEQNVYERLPFYSVYTACYIGFFLDGLVLYFSKRHASGGIKFFPVWAFCIPAALGLLIQSVYYGVSTISPFFAISLAGIVMSFQKEAMLTDKLTGLYNRFYLSTLRQRFRKRTEKQYSAIMLDINHFKQINDKYGHIAGDRALQQTADILTGVVNQFGDVIRYAGDEFIIILNISDEERVVEIVNRIRSEMDAFNQTGKEPYTLSVAAGFCQFSFGSMTADEFMDRIDRLMYDDKRLHNKDYYAVGEGSDSPKDSSEE